MNQTLPAATLGHFVIKVNDIDVSYQFYMKLGLRPIGVYPDLAIIELRGGTHILIFDRNEEMPFSINPSQTGQRGSFFDERFDLMIDGRLKSDLEIYRTEIIENGLSAGEISQDQFFGHYYFELVDPDGIGITLYTSHVGDLPV